MMLFGMPLSTRYIRPFNIFFGAVVILCLGAVWFGQSIYREIHGIYPASLGHGPEYIYGPENKTLGFGAIYVLSESEKTWRVQGLRKVASLTDLQLSIPQQKDITEEDVTAYLAGDKKLSQMNSTRALLNHLSLLEEFLKSGLQSALICEDDVDFSIHIKSQMRHLAEAIRQKHSSKWQSSDVPNTHVHDESASQQHELLGNDAWDILWLGHMGVEYAHETETVTYQDPHALPWTQLTSSFNNYYLSMAEKDKAGAPELQQIWFGVAPMATFAYAVTRAHAERMINKIRQERPQVFDVWLHTQCKGGWQKCVAPVPEVMHHQRVLGQTALSAAEAPDSALQDLRWWETRHKYTYNVEWSARCNAMGYGEKVGSLRQCYPSKFDHLI